MGAKVCLAQELGVGRGGEGRGEEGGGGNGGRIWETSCYLLSRRPPIILIIVGDASHATIQL
jgi:hypothetical protein